MSHFHVDSLAFSFLFFPGFMHNEQQLLDLAQFYGCKKIQLCKISVVSIDVIFPEWY
jgi:hypothetical protein